MIHAAGTGNANLLKAVEVSKNIDAEEGFQAPDDFRLPDEFRLPDTNDKGEQWQLVQAEHLHLDHADTEQTLTRAKQDAVCMHPHLSSVREAWSACVCFPWLKAEFGSWQAIAIALG